MGTSADPLSWLNELNDAQRAAITHGAGPLLIVAGAGSGKTRTLAYRVAYLIAGGMDPSRIMLLTFSRRAAEEMLKRAFSIIQRGAPSAGRVWGGTFHAIASRLLHHYGKLAGLGSDFTVMDQSDAEDMLNVIRHDMGLHSKEKRFPLKSTCLDVYSRCVNGTEDLAFVLKRHFPWCEGWQAELKALFKKYVERKQERNVLDYDDLLLYWSHLVADKDAAERIGGNFDHILVDEYQDTNPLQSGILRGMCRPGKSITVVGDDAQSIYSFRAATVRNMLDFPKQFPGAAVITLEQNYRSVPPILATTNSLIVQARERYTKNLWSSREGGQKPLLVTCKDEAAQDEYVLARVLEHYEQGIPLRRQAVLFRAAHLSDSLELELTRRHIPFHKYGGLRFLEASHVKDLIAFLRVVENPRDEMAWFRTLQLLDGIGPGTAAGAVRHLSARQYRPASLAEFIFPAAARVQAQAYVDMLLAIEGPPAPAPAAQVERVRRFYDPILEKTYENPKVRARDLEHLEQIAGSYRSRRQFLMDLQLDPPTSTGDLAGPPMKDEDWLVLSTIHSAKGCEWDAVFVIHAADGCLPSDMATGSREEIEEEMRLAYVAMTRAKDFLYVCWPLRYYHRWHSFTDRHSYAQMSRFLTDEVRRSMEAVSAPPEQPDGGPPDTGARRGDIAARIKSMWE